MNIFKYQLGQMQANAYLIVSGSDCLIIDPADEASFLLEEVARRRLNLIALLATHGHFDHIMATGEIQASINIPFYIFSEDKFLIDRVEETARHFLGYEPAVIRPIRMEFLRSGQFEIADFSCEVISTPGHTPGSSAFYFRKEKAVFTGDTLFKAGIGRFDFSYCNKEDLRTSLECLFKLPEETIVYSGHGETTTIGDERANSSGFFEFLK